MNKNVIRVAAAIPGIPMLINGIGFIATPLETSQSLGMELLTGIGLSTQLGDFTSFFIGTAVLIFLGAFKSDSKLLYAAALYLGGAAVFRTVAALFNGADMATDIIIVELVLTAWICTCAFLLGKKD